jgi:hypothetical protein
VVAILVWVWAWESVYFAKNFFKGQTGLNIKPGQGQKNRYSELSDEGAFSEKGFLFLSLTKKGG